MRRLSDAERLLQGYGVREPKQIDLEAIAWDLGAFVKYGRIDGCEARIVGAPTRAVITIDPSTGETRARFSLGHELGHWRRHRGEVLMCDKGMIGSMEHASRKEREADQFAADILMPHYIFEPMARSFDKPSFRCIDELSTAFQTSRKATARQFVNMNTCPCIVICHGSRGRLWFHRSDSWPKRWFPKDELDPQCDAFDLVYGQGSGSEATHRCLSPADAWFDQPDAESCEVWSHSVVTGVRREGEAREVLTLIIPKSPSMMDDVGYRNRRW